MPDILLRTPCFNGARYLPRALPALHRLNRATSTRIVLIDDGSTDDSAVMARDAGIEVRAQPENLGLAAARNRGSAAVDGAFVASLDADVAPSETWLDVLHAHLTSDPTLGGVGGELIESVTTGSVNAYRARHGAQRWGAAPMRNPPHLYGANTLFRTTVLREVGGYDERYRTNFEDVDLCHRLRARGVQLAYDPAATCFHLREDDFESLVRQQADGSACGHRTHRGGGERFEPCVSNADLQPTPPRMRETASCPWRACAQSLPSPREKPIEGLTSSA
jgi:O-antigen biosynthesis protein